MALKNIEEIIKKIKTDATTIKKSSKYDGITIEYTVKNKISRKDAVKEIKSICKTLGLNPISIEENKDFEDVFILQFPELVPSFTEKQIEKMYKDSFQWLIDNVRGNTEDVDRVAVASSRDAFVRQAITMYYRSNVNQYKEDIDKYLLDISYLAKVTSYFSSFFDDYFKGV